MSLELENNVKAQKIIFPWPSHTSCDDTHSLLSIQSLIPFILTSWKELNKFIMELKLRELHNLVTYKSFIDILSSKYVYHLFSCHIPYCSKN